MEHKTLWGLRGEVDPTHTATLGQAQTLRAGQRVTLVSWSKQVQVCTEACAQLAQQGIEVELIDLRTIWPWDRQSVLNSCARTGHLLVVHEAVQAAGFGAEVAATAAEATGYKVKRLGAPRIPVGYAPVLEAESRISPEQVMAAVHAMLK